MIDLHAAITAKLDKLTLLANAAKFDAASARWTAGMFRTGSLDISDHIATWDPATVLRGLAEDRDILARHVPIERLSDEEICRACNAEYWPCVEILSIARRHGVEVQP